MSRWRRNDTQEVTSVKQQQAKNEEGKERLEISGSFFFNFTYAYIPICLEIDLNMLYKSMYNSLMKIGDANLLKQSCEIPPYTIQNVLCMGRPFVHPPKAIPGLPPGCLQSVFLTFLTR